MSTLSDKQLASIQATFKSTLLRDQGTLSRRASKGSQGALKDGSWYEIGTYYGYLTSRIRQPDPDPENRSYATPAKVNTEDERHLWLEAGCPVQRGDRWTVNGVSYRVTNIVDDYTPMPGVMCAVQRELA